MKRTMAVLAVMLSILLCGSGRAAGKDLRDLIPGLYGGDGIRLADVAGHSPHFFQDSRSGIDLLNEQIASQVAVLPFSSAAGGFTYSFDPVRGSFVRTTENLGPLFAERAPTLGRGKFNFNVAYTFYRFDEFEGDKTDNLRVVARACYAF
jgi:hypothetical protein